jgi:hypothetical protein
MPLILSIKRRQVMADPAAPSTLQPSSPSSPVQPAGYVQPTLPEYDTRPIGEKLSDLGAGAAGVGSGLLFDIPGAVYKAVAGDKSYQDFLNSQHGKMFQEGQKIGDVGSAFIPIGGIAGKAIEGAGKLAEGSKLGAALSKIGAGVSKVGTATEGVGKLALRGGLEAGLGQGLRSVANQDPNGAVNTLIAAALGSGGGAIGGSLAKNIKRAPQILEETANSADAQVAKDIFGVTPKAIKKSLNSNPLTNGSGLTEQRVESAFKKIADLKRSGVATDPLDVKMMLQEQGPFWQAAEEKYTAAMDAAKQA